MLGLYYVRLKVEEASMPSIPGRRVMSGMENMNKHQVKRITVKQKAARLRVSVTASEKKYGCSSEHMLDALKSGKANETREVSQWLFNYRALRRLEGHAGRTTGIYMKDTKRFTGAT